MIPLAVLFAIVVVARALAGARANMAVTGTGLGIFLLFAGRFVGGVALVVIGLDALPAGSGVAALLVALVLFWPTSVLRHLLVPLGLPRAVYYATRVLRPLSFRMRTEGGALLYAVLAAARARRSSTLDRFLEARLDDARAGPEVALARGILEHLQGRDDRARLLFGAVRDLPERIGAGVARAWAYDLLVADRARRGDWDAVVKLGGESDAGSWARTVRAITRYRADKAPDRRFAMISRWLASPERRALAPRVWSALRAAELQPPRRRRESPEGTLLERAVRRHGQLAVDGGVEEVVTTARAWDAAFRDPATTAALTRRSLALGAKLDGESLLDDLRTQVASDLEEIVERRSLPLRRIRAGRRSRRDAEEVGETDRDDEDQEDRGGAELGPIVAARVEARRIDDADVAARAFAAESPPQGVEAWVAWQRLRNACERASTDRATQRSLHSVLWPRVCNRAVGLFNVEGQQLLAHSVFAYAHAFAEAAGDEDAARLLERNIEAPF